MNAQSMTPEVAFGVRLIAKAIEAVAIDTTTERAAHDGLERCLTSRGFAVTREVQIGPGDRIDLIVEWPAMSGQGIGVEIKTGHSRVSILRQLERYAKSDRISGLVLATGTPFPLSEVEIGGKPFAVVSLARGWL